MVFIRKARNRIRALFRNGREEAELAEEMQFHLDMEIEKNLARGMSQSEARRAAKIAFGGLEQVKEDCRESWGIRVVMDLIRAIRFGSKRLVRHKGFTVAVLLALGLCVGGNTAVFTTLYSLIYKDLPFDQDNRLVEIYHVHSKLAPTDHLKSNPAIYLQYVEEAESFECLSLHTSEWSSAFQEGRSYRLKGTKVAGDFFKGLHSRAVIGRLFGPEDSSNDVNSMVISKAFWRSNYAESEEVLGQSIQVGQVNYQIIGVLADDSHLLFPETHFFIPWSRSELIALASGDDARQEFYATLWARLKSDVSAKKASLELASLDNAFFEQSGTFAQTVRDSQGYVTRVESLRKLRNAWIEPKLYLLQGVSLLILIIGLVNVVNMLLAHANAQRQETAVRETLGATRRRIMAQCMVEVGQLACWGWLFSIGVALFGLALLKKVSPDIGQYGTDIRFDGFSLGFSFALALAASVVMYLALTTNLLTGIKCVGQGNQRQSMGKRTRRAASALVLAQITISVILLVGTGLLAKSFWNVLNQDSGYDPEGVVTARIELAEHRYDEAVVEQTRNRVLEHVRQLPSVRSAAVATQIPMFGYPASKVVTPVEQQGGVGRIEPWSKFVFVSEEYFETLGVSLLEGRSFEPRDRAFWHEVNIAEEGALERLASDVAVGFEDRFFKWGQAPKNPQNWNRIVGVAENTLHETLDTNQGLPLIYRPIRGTYNREFSLLIKSDLPSEDAILMVQRSLAELDPMLTVFRVGALESFMDQTLASRRGLLSLVSAYALLALFLSMTGVFGLLAYDVATRIKEIGIRISIGASRAQVLWHVLSKGLFFGVVGLGLGLLGALLLQRVIEQFLFAIPAIDVAVYALSMTVLFATILLASLIPALRAVHVDPLVALRRD